MKNSISQKKSGYSSAFDLNLLNCKVKDRFSPQKLNQNYSQRAFVLNNLFDQLSSHHYCVIDSNTSFNPSEFEEETVSVLIPQYLKKLIANIFKKVNTSGSISRTRNFGKHIYQIEFEQETPLTVIFHFEFNHKGNHFSLPKKALLNAKRNHYGIKVMSDFDLFEFIFCDSFLKNEAIPLYFPSHLLLKTKGRRIMEYLNYKYHLNIKDLRELNHFNPIITKKIKNIISLKKENKSWNWFQNKLKYIIETFKDKISSPKTSMQNKLLIKGLFYGSILKKINHNQFS